MTDKATVFRDVCTGGRMQLRLDGLPWTRPVQTVDPLREKWAGWRVVRCPDNRLHLVHEDNLLPAVTKSPWSRGGGDDDEPPAT